MKFNITVRGKNCSAGLILLSNKDDFLKKITELIDNCDINGGTFFSITIESDRSCFPTVHIN